CPDVAHGHRSESLGAFSIARFDYAIDVQQRDAIDFLAAELVGGAIAKILEAREDFDHADFGGALCGEKQAGCAGNKTTSRHEIHHPTSEAAARGRELARS